MEKSINSRKNLIDKWIDSLVETSVLEVQLEQAQSAIVKETESSRLIRTDLEASLDSETRLRESAERDAVTLSDYHVAINNALNFQIEAMKIDNHSQEASLMYRIACKDKAEKDMLLLAKECEHLRFQQAALRQENTSLLASLSSTKHEASVAMYSSQCLNDRQAYQIEINKRETLRLESLLEKEMKEKEHLNSVIASLYFADIDNHNAGTIKLLIEEKTDIKSLKAPLVSAYSGTDQIIAPAAEAVISNYVKDSLQQQQGSRFGFDVR